MLLMYSVSAHAAAFISNHHDVKPVKPNLYHDKTGQNGKKTGQNGTKRDITGKNVKPDWLIPLC